MDTTTKITLVVANMPAHLVDEIVAAAASHGLSVTLWLKLVIESELEREREKCKR